MNDSARYILTAGALLMMLAVMLGAFGAHALKQSLSPELLSVYKTGVEYHFIHALGLLIIGALALRFPESSWLAWAAIALGAGIVLFSGSLYILSLTGIRWLGAITPFGGLAFILGWLSMAVGIFRL